MTYVIENTQIRGDGMGGRQKYHRYYNSRDDIFVRLIDATPYDSKEKAQVALNRILKFYHGPKPVIIEHT